jgi:hypothetical protein
LDWERGVVVENEGNEDDFLGCLTIIIVVEEKSLRFNKDFIVVDVLIFLDCECQESKEDFDAYPEEEEDLVADEVVLVVLQDIVVDFGVEIGRHELLEKVHFLDCGVG